MILHALLYLITAVKIGVVYKYRQLESNKFLMETVIEFT